MPAEDRSAKALAERSGPKAAAILPALVLGSALTLTSVSPAIRLLIFAEISLSLWNPVGGLLALAFVAPLGQLIASRLAGPIQLTDALALAFLFGWLVHRHEPRRGPRLPRFAAIAASILAATAVIQIAWLARTAVDPGAGLVRFARDYLLTNARDAVEPAALLEGVAIAAAVVAMFRRRPALAITLPAALVTGLTVRAAFVWAAGAGISPAIWPAVVMMVCAGLGALLSAASGRSRLQWTLAMAAMGVVLKFANRAPVNETLVVHGFEHVFDAVAASMLVVFLGSALWRAVHGIVARPRDMRLIGCVAGLLAYIAVTIVIGAAGVSDGTICFWLVLGLALALAGSNLLANEPIGMQSAA
jgi:hypothetical protein